ncbi:hypothetical protein EVAR_52177_1 [Eumeta japonica]|uniref:Uncharacterized protein n=1 Tax=Eumeta variegata TaxID=151549 RepID=A0A4C1YDI2_EUMVA|nr:hypothetical protein EVAR_52177_1 [Eumeta japonica]
MDRLHRRCATVYKCEGAVSTVAFHPVRKGFGGLLSRPSAHSPSIRYATPFQEIDIALVTLLELQVHWMAVTTLFLVARIFVYLLYHLKVLLKKKS